MVEEPAADRKFRKELSAGTTSLALLAILCSSDEALYGYQIASTLSDGAEGEPQPLKQGTLYPVLWSLERNGLLESVVEPSTSGPPRRYYHATVEGVEALNRWKSIWRSTAGRIEALLGGEGA